MKTKVSILTLGFAGLLLAGCATTGSTSAPGDSSSTSKTKPYPLDVCLVTDNELGSMGKPITQVYNGQTVKFCCKPCVREFNAEPEKYLKKIQ